MTCHLEAPRPSRQRRGRIALASCLTLLVSWASAIDAVAGGADNAFSFIGAGAFSGTAGQLRAYSSGGSNYVAGDVNGDGVADFTIQTNLLLASSDFIL